MHPPIPICRLRPHLCTVLGMLFSLAGAAGSGCASPPSAPKNGLTYATPDLNAPVVRAPGSRSSTDSRVIVSIRPIGSVPFDGMTLPLTSPNGRFLATQSGSTPSFAAVLAEPGIAVPAGLKVTAAAIAEHQSVSPETPAIVPLSWSGSLPRGLLLGRSCDDRGFLVEQPRPDGSRRIGFVDWQSGSLTWLVDSPGTVAAFATLGPDGQLAFSRRTLAAPGFELVVRANASDPSSERVLKPSSPDESYCCPTFSADRQRVYVFRSASRMVEQFGPLSVLAVSLASGDSTEMTVVSRADLNVEPTPAAAFQAVAPMQSPWNLPGEPPDPLDRGIAITDLNAQTMVWIDGPTGHVEALAPMTAGAAPLVDRLAAKSSVRGMLLGTAKELVFQPYRSVSAGPTWGGEASVLSGPFVPRLAGWLKDELGGLRPRYILLSPPKSGQSVQVQVFFMVTAD